MAFGRPWAAAPARDSPASKPRTNCPTAWPSSSTTCPVPPWNRSSPNAAALQQNEAVNLAQQICEAVQELHRLGILHRDLTPANIIVADDGAHIIDLGIARPLTDTANRNRDNHRPRHLRIRLPRTVRVRTHRCRSDVFSLGRILGFMLTGVYPDDTRYTPLLSDDLHVTPRLRAIVERATAFEPSARYQNVTQFARALTSPTDPADSHVPAYAVQRPVANGKPRPRTVIAVAVACVAVFAIVAAAVLIPRWIADGSDGGAATERRRAPDPGPTRRRTTMTMPRIPAPTRPCGSPRRRTTPHTAARNTATRSNWWKPAGRRMNPVTSTTRSA